MRDEKKGKEHASDKLEEPRQPGRLKGQIIVDEGFFEPLPEEELVLREGRADNLPAPTKERM